MKIKVSYEFLEACAEKNSCASLDMYEPSKSRGQVFEWKRHHWVCHGSAHSAAKGYMEANLTMVVPEAEYHGPPNNPYLGPKLYYLGGRLRDRRGKIWVMTSKEVTLIPINQFVKGGC